MTFVVRPAPELLPYMTGYWFVQDLTGAYEGAPVRTCPQPGAVLSVNFGRPNAMVGGPVVPRVSLLGIQSVSRTWRSWENTYFVMVMLTVEGLVRLFPGSGASADQLVDLASLIGEVATGHLYRLLDAAWEPPRVAAGLDWWLLGRLETVMMPPELPRLAAAHTMLRSRRSVEAAAAAADVTRRQLSRWYRTHLGTCPKQMMDLERLQKSIRAAQNGQGDPLSGFSDQAHQIRSWRRRLGTTPGRYVRFGPSELATRFAPPGAGDHAFYL